MVRFYRIMRVKMRRIQRVAIGLLAIFSLSASSIAACTCSHHQEDPGPEKSCHGGTVSKKRHKTIPPTTSPSAGESCVCIQPATKLSVKSDPFKFKKQSTGDAAAPKVVPVRFRLVSTIPDTELTVVDEIRFPGSKLSRGPPLS